MEKERIALYDNVRAVLICLVVVGHFLDDYTAGSGAFRSAFVFIYAFHMPLFIFLSGLFQKDSGTLARTVGLICVGFALKITFTLVRLLLGWNVSFSLLGDDWIPWFMFTLAAYTASGWVLRSFDKRFLLVFSILVGCFVGYDSTIGDQLYLSRIVVFYPFFVLGQMCDREKLEAVSEKRWLRLAGLAVLSIWAALCLFAREQIYTLRPLFTGRNPFSVNELFLPWGCGWRLLCYGISAVTGFALICVTPSRRLPVVSAYGARTLEIYYWHGPVRNIFNYFGIYTLCATRSGKLIWLACAVGTTLLTGTKPFSFPARQILRWSQPVESKTRTEKIVSHD